MSLGKNPELSCWYSPADFHRFTKIKFVQSKFETKIGAVSSKQWSTLKGTEFPFSEHNYLNALEESSSVGEESGWLPCHLTLWEKSSYREQFAYTKNITDTANIFLTGAGQMLMKSMV